MKPLTPNTMIQNRYLIVQPIGKGGMGDVYLAVDQRLGSAVALKRTFFSDDGALGTAFEREARILARLRHPVLPKVIDHFAENGDQYLVMEHISGDDLSKRLENQNKPFPLSWVMFWADQLLDALSYLHTHEPPIIHRDIKPQNLKLTDENHIVLLDFGLSKDFDSSKPGDGMNSASVAGYSPHFAAMEQIRGTGTDGRSDLYSLSATLYQLMANSIPCEALTRADALLGGREDPIVPLSDLNPEVPQAVSEVILKGISLRQEERFATAAEMQRTLRRAYNRGQNEPAVPKEDTKAAKPEPAPQAAAFQTESKAAPNFDATLKIEDVAVTSAPKQADVKTEVFSRAELAGAAGTSTEAGQQGIAQPPIPASQPNVEDTNGSTTKTSVNRKRAAGAAAGVPTGQGQKTSKSKKGLVVAGLAGLVIFAAIAAGGGWYAYSNYFATAVPQPSPTVQVGSPDLQQAAEPEGNANSTADLPNSNSVPVSDPVNANVEASATPGTPSSRPTGGTTKAPPKQAKPPAPKTTKPGSRDDRTVILQ